MDYIERFTKRGNAIKSAYTADDSKAHHRHGSNALIDVMADIFLRARVNGLDTVELVAKADAVADQEFYFAEPHLREALTSKPVTG